jgi:hypothetical protein
MKERVLSYQLAQALTLEEVQHVSGGAHQTTYTTLRGSGDTNGNFDSGIDFSWDY